MILLKHTILKWVDVAKTIISYDQEIPEIPGRRPWEAPTSYLVKDEDAPTGWREEQSGRRHSQVLLVPYLREKVDTWRVNRYAGASEVTHRLFEYWFEEDHEVLGFDSPFRYYFCQREAIETLVWLIEIAGQRDAVDFIKAHVPISQNNLMAKNIEFVTAIGDKRRIRRHDPESDTRREQELPPEDLRRFAFKMATGSGKTWVIAMAITWARFHRLLVPGSELSTNFLIVAPNVIVYQRLEKDFADNKIFHKLPLIPPEWKDNFSQRVILRGDSANPGQSSNLFLTNIQQLYEREEGLTTANAVEVLLGRKPKQDIVASGQQSMLERIKSLHDLIVFNDEAHHVHNEELAWTKYLLSIHEALPNGITAWLDFSATPKDQNGMFFPWTVCDYPLAQATEDRIVKAPIVVTNEGSDDRSTEEPESVNKYNITERYDYWLRAAVTRWKEHWKTYRKLKIRPVLFIVAEKNAYADAIGEVLHKNQEFGFDESEILVIHTDNTGEVRKGDLEKARQAARDIDKDASRIKVIVSVMMLREGWDVRNVTIVLGLRPFTARAEILPEQVIGRGLRLMTQVSPDRTQTLEVLGTAKLIEFLHTQLEVEGVSVVSRKNPPPLPVMIEPLKDRLGYDIQIPITKPTLKREHRNLNDLDLSLLDPIYDQVELDEAYRTILKMEYTFTETTVHQEPVLDSRTLSEQDILSDIATKTMNRAGLTGCFADLCEIVKYYVMNSCFGRRVDLDEESVHSYLNNWEIRDGISRYLANVIGRLIIEYRPIEFDKRNYHLSETKPFQWRRNLPPLEAKKTIFNYVATYNPFERQFAKFMDQAADVLRFAALGTTEQGGSGTSFKVDYLKPSGAIGFYHPDWVAVQDFVGGEVNWIIETKGREWEGTEQKDRAMYEWCRRISAETDTAWKYIRVNQRDFNPELKTLKALTVSIISKAMFAERDQRGTTMSGEEVRQARDEGRR